MQTGLSGTQTTPIEARPYRDASDYRLLTLYRAGDPVATTEIEHRTGGLPAAVAARLCSPQIEPEGFGTTVYGMDRTEWNRYGI